MRRIENVFLEKYLVLVRDKYKSGFKIGLFYTWEAEMKSLRMLTLWVFFQTSKDKATQR